MPEHTRTKAEHLLIAAVIIIAVAAILAVALLIGASDPLQPPQPSENTTKVTAAPGSVILLQLGMYGENYSATLNSSSHAIQDPDIENYLWNKVTEYDRSISGYGVNETGYLTIFLEICYSPDEPGKTLAAINTITIAKKIPLLPIQFIIPELDYQIERSEDIKHNTSVTEERLADILRNIIASQPPENITKVTAAPGTLILLQLGMYGENYSATLNTSSHVIKDQDIESHLWNKVTEYNRSICDYGVNETGYLTILLEDYYSPEEPGKTLVEIDKITTAKKIPPLPVRFIIAELRYDIEIAGELWHNASVTEERLTEILRHITSQRA